MSNEQRHGKKAATMNVQLGNFMGKSSISMEDMRLLFASIDCCPPSSSLLQSEADTSSRVFEELNTETMKLNCQLATNMAINANGVIVATDTVYNNPPKGKSTYQPGTQAHSPMVDAYTGMVLSVVSHNKLCSRNCKGPCGPKCTVNWNPLKAMAGAERVAAAENAQRVTDCGVKIAGLVCDGTAKTLSGKNFSTSLLNRNLDKYRKY